MIQLVTFDLDNTLWEVMPVIIAAEKTLRAWLEERVPGYSAQITAERMTELRNAAIQRDQNLIYNISDLRRLLLHDALLQCGLTPTDAAPLAREAFDVFMRGRNNVEFYPDALSTVEQLAGRYQLGALTNGNADISTMPLADHFRFSMSPDKVQARKPDPKIFSATLATANCHANHAVHVGDHLEEDIDGAIAAGWQAVWVNLTGQKEPEHRNYSAMVTRLSDLPAAISALA